MSSTVHEWGYEIAPLVFCLTCLFCELGPIFMGLWPVIIPPRLSPPQPGQRPGERPFLFPRGIFTILTQVPRFFTTKTCSSIVLCLSSFSSELSPILMGLWFTFTSPVLVTTLGGTQRNALLVSWEIFTIFSQVPRFLATETCNSTHSAEFLPFPCCGVSYPLNYGLWGIYTCFNIIL